MLQWWSEFRSNVSTDSKAYDSIIWNNCNIKIDGKPICYHNYMNAGVIFIIDLMYSRNNVESKGQGVNGLKLLDVDCCICTMFSVQNFKRHFVSEYPITKDRKDSK